MPAWQEFEQAKGEDSAVGVGHERLGNPFKSPSQSNLCLGGDCTFGQWQGDYAEHQVACDLGAQLIEQVLRDSQRQEGIAYLQSLHGDIYRHLSQFVAMGKYCQGQALPPTPVQLGGCRSACRFSRALACIRRGRVLWAA
ncbi:hypothetical protein D3C76_1212930 [compost metagenome]